MNTSLIGSRRGRRKKLKLRTVIRKTKPDVSRNLSKLTKILFRHVVSERGKDRLCDFSPQCRHRTRSGYLLGRIVWILVESDYRLRPHAIIHLQTAGLQVFRNDSRFHSDLENNGRTTLIEGAAVHD